MLIIKKCLSRWFLVDTVYHMPKYALRSKEKVVLFLSTYSFDANETMDMCNKANTSIFTDDEGNDDDNSSTEDARYTDNVALGYYYFILVITI